MKPVVNDPISYRFLFWETVKQYFQSRNYKSLAKSQLGLLPGLAAVALVWAAIQHPWNLRHGYQLSGWQALKARDFEQARLCYRRIMLQNEDPMALFGLAMVAVGKEELNEARSIMERIAPPETGGYAQAHLWLAMDLASRPPRDPQKWCETIERHLSWAHERGAENTTSHILLANLYLQSHRLEQAMDEFSRVARERPQYHMQVARLARSTGNIIVSQTHAAHASEFYMARSHQDGDDIPSRLLWAEAEMYLDHFELSKTILQQNEEQQSDPRIHRALVQVHIEKCDHLLNRIPPRYGEALDELERALELAPHESQILMRLGLFVQPRADDRRARLRRILEEQLVAGHASATVHLLLGTIAICDEQFEDAIDHFALGLRQKPESASLLNNLAWALAHGDGRDLDRALRLSESAIVVAPDRAEFLETRGQIHFKCERWADAISDLERALQHVPNRSRVHASLAEAYAKLDQPQMAEYHRKRAEQTQPVLPRPPDRSKPHPLP